MWQSSSTSTEPATGCPVSAAAQGLADPLLYAGADFDFRSIWDRMRGEDHLEWTQVDERLGFWSVVKYHDADRVLRDAQTFTSERGTLLNILGVEDPAGGRQIAATDPPRHTIMRARLQRPSPSRRSSSNTT